MFPDVALVVVLELVSFLPWGLGSGVWGWLPFALFGVERVLRGFIQRHKSSGFA